MIRQEKQNPYEIKNNPVIRHISLTQELSHVELVLLRSVEYAMAGVCAFVLIYLVFFEQLDARLLTHYIVLVTVVFLLILIAILLYSQKKFVLSSYILVLSGTIGPWWSALVDPSILQGNLLPLVYIAIPILLSSFFLPTGIMISISVIQIIGLVLFAFYFNFNLAGGISSLVFFLIFILTSSMTFIIRNKHNKRIISKQILDLENQSMHDPLTGLYNRRFLGGFLEREFARLNRSGGDLSIIILDIDHFKQYNDTYGHACGDDVLVNISKLLNTNFRSSDIICRYGGDEFLIVLNDSTIDDALLKAQALQKLVAEKTVICEVGSDVQATLSIGIAGFPTHGRTHSDVIRSADQALHLAKEKGKNRIEVFNQNTKKHK
jgi:diguanylate cyclase (GGDEF)-like protein